MSRWPLVLRYDLPVTRVRVGDANEAQALRDIIRCLEAGDPVEIERGGRLVGRAQPVSEHADPWGALYEMIKDLPPLDDAFGEKVEEARTLLNDGLKLQPWEL